MKVLTNIRFAQTAGIAQNLKLFLSFVKKSKKGVLEVIGVNIVDQKEKRYKRIKNGNVTIISINMPIPNIKDVLNKVQHLEEVKREYAQVITAYREAIKKEKPDMVLVNGTYYMPWSLFLAADLESVPVVLHYHGLLTKETEEYPKKQRKLFRDMERSFDKSNLSYIFPSKMAKKMVEGQVFRHKIKKYFILPSPVPLYFFNNDGCGDKRNIGIISRWAKVKNIDFCKALAEYNSEKNGKFIINLITDLNPESRCYKDLSPKIKFWPPRSNKSLLGFYKNMGIMISPSHFETYGNVAKEALAAGVPAIISHNMGVSETFKGLGLKTWIGDFSSIKKIYSKIEDVAGRGVEDSIRLTIKKLYSPEKIFNKMVDILIFAQENIK